jgi:hypothetical protein
MNRKRLPEELGLTDDDIESLSQRGLVRAVSTKPLPKEHMDAQPWQTYAGNPAEGWFSSRDELARHPGESKV